MNILLDIAFGYKHTDDDDSFVLSLTQSISQKLTSYITQWKEKQTVSMDFINTAEEAKRFFASICLNSS